MINKRTERRLFSIVVWLMAGLSLVIMLTSCDPYQGLAAGPVTTETPIIPTATRTPTAYPEQKIAQGPTPTPLTCTVQTGIPRGHLNLRTGAGVNHSVIKVLSEGETLKVLERAAWLQVIDKRGNQGFINGRYCK